MKIGVSMSQFDDTWLTYLRESMDTKAKSYPDGVKLQFFDPATGSIGFGRYA